MSDLEQSGASGGSLVVRWMVERGIDVFFEVPGETFLSILDALYEAKRIRVAVMRHEGGASFGRRRLSTHSFCHGSTTVKTRSQLTDRGVTIAFRVVENPVIGPSTSTEGRSSSQKADHSTTHYRKVSQSCIDRPITLVRFMREDCPWGL